MSSVPYIFANQIGTVPLSHLDDNFANVKASVDYATAAGTAGTVTTGAQPAITSVGALTSLSATGNIKSDANIIGGNVYATTTISGASHIGSVVSMSGNITAVANIAGGNLLATSKVSASSHIGSIVSVTGNITGGNILTSGLVSATGNITGGNLTISNKTTTKTVDTYNNVIGTVSGNVTVDVSAGEVQTLTTAGNISLSFSNWGASSTNSKVTLEITVANAEHKITNLSGIENASGVIGFSPVTGVMAFPIPSKYALTFSSINNGANISLNENNVLLRPYNARSEGITTTANALISLGTTYSVYNPSPLSTTGTAYLPNGIAGQIKILGSLGTSTWTVTVPSASWGGSNTVNFTGARENITMFWDEAVAAWFVIGSNGNVTVS